ncbi:MAG: class I SAM-dependent methyltransferase [Actinobacteria bacterium]|nr:class I SAM-dependent methyltransferase [Actinomycetota bacterium]
MAAYLAIPVDRDFAPVLDDLWPGASVLDLGCGVGRLANELARRGHEVVGVDESAEMLAHLDAGVQAVQARIEDLDLGRTFDVVVLASHFVNTADAVERHALLACVARHLSPGGSAYVEHWNPDVIDDLHDGEGTAGDVVLRFRLLEQRGAEFDAAITYVVGGEEWTQTFTAEILDEAQLEAAVEAAGLQVFGRLDPKWLVATR